MEIDIQMKFKSYSQTRPDLKEKVYPTLELRCWNEVRIQHDHMLGKHLNQIWNYDYECTESALNILQNRYRAINFALTPDDDGIGYITDVKDAINISLDDDYDEFFFWELLSIYFNEVNQEPDANIDLLFEICESIFSQFGVNMMIRNNQFVPRQSEKIVAEIYDPTFDLLNDSTYDGVNNELNKAFGSFRAKDYNDVIIKSINAVQAALQILVDGEVNQKKKINVLLKEAKNNQLLSDYELTNTIYLNINSFLERIRKDKAGVHPTNGSAYQSDALFVLNLTMVLLQNLILNNNSKIQG